jgi:Mg2+ and Co2+ transporter CorA
MSGYYFKTTPVSRGVTLHYLKDQLYSLNMRLLLAIQHHNEEMQEDIKKQMAEIQAEIDQMCLRGRHPREKF